jgi:hypothetical protein
VRSVASVIFFVPAVITCLSGGTPVRAKSCTTNPSQDSTHAQKAAQPTKVSTHAVLCMHIACTMCMHKAQSCTPPHLFRNTFAEGVWTQSCTLHGRRLDTIMHTAWPAFGHNHAHRPICSASGLWTLTMKLIRRGKDLSLKELDRLICLHVHVKFAFSPLNF